MYRTSFWIGLIVLGYSCTPAGPADDEGLRIAYVQDLSAPDADEHALPALRAAELAVAMDASEEPPIQIVVFDLAGEPGAVADIVGDRSVVAAVVGPGADGAAVAEAGVPTLSVSTSGPTPQSGSWARLVAPLEVAADRIAEEVEGRRACVLSEDPAPDGLAALLAVRLDVPAWELEPEEGAAMVEIVGCEAVAWGGSADPAVELARGLPTGVVLVGGDRLLDPDFRDDVGPAGEGTIAVCACADLSTSIRADAMRFVQDYQSEFGTAPGPYAVEAWDAVRAILGLVRSGIGERQAIATALATPFSLQGMATTYSQAAGGELAAPQVRSLVLRGGRWS